MKIPLKAIYSAAPNRAAGYVEEVKKRGKIQGSDVELSESDFEYIAKNFKSGSKIEAETKPKVEISKSIQEVKSEVRTEVKVDALAIASEETPQVTKVLVK